jgi:hypothetical protein
MCLYIYTFDRSLLSPSQKRALIDTIWSKKYLSGDRNKRIW